MNTELHDAITALREQVALVRANWSSNRLAATVRDLIGADEELGRVIDSQFDYYLLAIEGDCHPELMGPMACDAHRVTAARDLRAGNFDGGLYRVTVPTGTPITVEPFGGAEIDEEEPPAPEPDEPEVLKLGGAMREIPMERPPATRGTITVTIEVQVDDLPALVAAAVQRAKEEGTPFDSADPEGPSDTGALLMLLDPGTLPGCSILGSNATNNRDW